MPRSFLYSLFLHIVLILGLVLKFQAFERTKKLSYQKISARVIVKPKDNSKDNNTVIPETKEIKQPVVSQKAEDVKPPKEDRIEKIKVEKPLKVEKEKPKEIKMEKKERKKLVKPVVDKAKKEKKKIHIKDKKQKDIFSKLLDHKANDLGNISQKIANLTDNDIAIIKEQISRYWIKTPCPNDVNIELEIVINSSCHIISRSIDMKQYAHSSQMIACANSALRATQQCEKLNLDIKKCRELNNKIIILNFNTMGLLTK